MWDPPKPGLEPVSPALPGGFPTTAPPGKPLHIVLIRAPDIGFRATLIQCDLIVTNYIRKDPISNLTRSDILGGREFFGGHLFNP